MQAVTLILAIAIGLSFVNSAAAGWFSALVHEATEGAERAAGRAGRSVELAPLKSAAGFLDKLDNAPKTALAAHATPEGHWQFVNRDGQTFTVGTPEEMSRVLPALVSDVGSDKRMSLYLSEDSVFANRVALSKLPADAELSVVFDNIAYPITRSGKGADILLKVKLAPHLSMELRSRAAFEETAYLLGRPLNKANIRSIAFEPGSSASLSAAPKLDAVSKVPLVDQLDPGKLETGLRPLRGQTALVTGRVEGGDLVVTPANGTDTRVPMDRLIAAARENDVNLVVLQSDSSRQAGGRNWLWQKISIGGMDAATGKATFGDFLDALAARRGGFLLTANADGGGRFSINAVPDPSAAGLSDSASNIVLDLVSHVTGEVLTNAVTVDARDRDAQTEHDIRLIPWLPAGIQFLYLGGIVFGIAGWATARRWWSALSRVAAREVSGKLSALKRALSDLAFVLLFLPFVGLFAFAVQSAHQLIQLILAPFRWIRRRFLLRQV